MTSVNVPPRSIQNCHFRGFRRRLLFPADSVSVTMMLVGTSVEHSRNDQGPALAEVWFPVYGGLQIQDMPEYLVVTRQDALRFNRYDSIRLRHHVVHHALHYSA